MGEGIEDHIAQASILDEYKVKFASLYKKAYQGSLHPHYVFACHAAYPSIITADLLYQVWYNFRSYKLEGEELEFMPFEVVNDFLLSDCCMEIGEGLFKVEQDVREQLLDDLKRCFGTRHFLRVVKLLDHYAERNTETYYVKRIKSQHKDTVEASIDPEAALDKMIQTLKKDDLKRRDLVRMKVKLDTFEQDNKAFGRLKKLVLEAEKGIRGKAQDRLFEFEEREESLTEPPIGIISFGMPREQISTIEFRDFSGELARLVDTLQKGDLIPLQIQARPSSLKKIFEEYGKRIKFFHYGGIPAELIQGIDLNEDSPPKVQAERLAEFLGGALDLNFAFLNVDYSSSFAEILLEAGVGCIVATNASIDRDKSANFAASFYNSLIQGNTLSEAFSFARFSYNPPRKMSKAQKQQREEPFPYSLITNPNNPGAENQTLKDWQIKKVSKKVESTVSSKLNLNRHLDLSNQGLEEIPADILAETSILSLNLSNNQIKVVPAQLLNLVELRQLNLDNNPHLNSHNFAWDQLQNLEVLQLSRTDLKRVPLSLGQCHSLRQLKLYRNEIEEFPEHLLGLDNLELLDLSYNQIRSLPDVKGPVYKLKRLHLEWNLIDELPENIGKFSGLEILQIHANNLTRLPKSIWDLNSLQSNEQKHKYLMGLRLELNPFPFNIPAEKYTEYPQSLISYVMAEQEKERDQSKTIVHALVIGIDKYVDRGYSTLKGCVRDARRVEAAFRARFSESHDLRMHGLYDEAATKEGIVKTLEMISATVLTGDIVLFFFGGHSHYELTELNWDKEQASNLLQGLACHDSSLKSDSRALLSGMELRYLYDKISLRGGRIIGIFDTHYNGLFKTGLETEGSPLPARAWEDFIFSEEKSEALLMESSDLEAFIPEAYFIEIYAASGDEQAYEVRNSQGQIAGLFTTTFLSIMEEKDWNISYASLQKRMQESLKGREQKQTPYVVASGLMEAELYRSFLNGEEIDKLIQVNITFNPFNEKWFIDLGALHGLTMDANISIAVATQKGLTSARIIQLLTSSSEIEFLGEIDLNPVESHIGVIMGVNKTVLKVIMGGEKAGNDVLQAYLQEENRKENWEGIEFVNKREEANYELRAEKDAYFIVSIGDERPLARRIEAYEFYSLDEIFQQFQHIREWREIQDLQNPAVREFYEGMIQVYLHEDEGEPRRITSIPEVNYLQAEGPRFRLEFRNESEHNVFLAALMMSSQFGVQTDFLPRVVELPPGESIFAAEGGRFRFDIPDYVREYNWEEEINTLKLILSSEPFDVSAFQLENLEQEIRRRQSATRSLQNFEPLSGSGGDWLTVNYGFRMKNPDYIAADPNTDTTSESEPTRKLLMLASQPGDRGVLGMREEFREIYEELRISDNRDKYSLASNFSVKAVDVSNAILREKPDILHFTRMEALSPEVNTAEEGLFIGKGIFVEDEEGQAQVLNPDAIGRIFSVFEGEISCVVLNASYEEEQAEAISTYIDFVIGIPRELPDKLALEFLKEFYKAFRRTGISHRPFNPQVE